MPSSVGAHLGKQRRSLLDEETFTINPAKMHRRAGRHSRNLLSNKKGKNGVRILPTAARLSLATGFTRRRLPSGYRNQIQFPDQLSDMAGILLAMEISVSTDRHGSNLPSLLSFSCRRRTSERRTTPARSALTGRRTRV